jgi:hypothetical protein
LAASSGESEVSINQLATLHAINMLDFITVFALFGFELEHAIRLRSRR